MGASIERATHETKSQSEQPPITAAVNIVAASPAVAVPAEIESTSALSSSVNTDIDDVGIEHDITPPPQNANAEPAVHTPHATTFCKDKLERVFVDTSMDIKPLQDLMSFTKFKRNITKNLLKWPPLRPTHAYTWPHLMDGHSLILIDNNADKRMAFLPAICSRIFVMKFEFFVSHQLVTGFSCPIIV